MPAKKYVCIQYEPILGLDEMTKKFHDSSANAEENDFVECLAYAKDQFVLMKGKLVDKVEQTKVSISLIEFLYFSRSSTCKIFLNSKISKLFLELT